MQSEKLLRSPTLSSSSPVPAPQQSCSLQTGKGFTNTDANTCTRLRVKIHVWLCDYTCRCLRIFPHYWWPSRPSTLPLEFFI